MINHAAVVLYIGRKCTMSTYTARHRFVCFFFKKMSTMTGMALCDVHAADRVPRGPKETPDGEAEERARGPAAG
jgi:hypothetical protein